MIQMFHVSKTFDGGIAALVDINLHIQKGEMVFLVGATGAGKTTLLRLLYGDEIPTSGQILISGKSMTRSQETDLPALRRGMGIIFQDFKLLKDRSVYENLAFTCRILGYSPTEEKRRVGQVLTQVDLTSKAHHNPCQLSGGEQQRVAIARALIHDPLILLADEPTGNLDPAMAEGIFRLLKEIHLRGTTVLVATHDPERTKLGDYRIHMQKGRIMEERSASRPY